MDAVHVDAEIVPMLAGAPMFVLDEATVAAIRSAGFSPGAAPVLSDAVTRTEYVVSEEPRVVVRVHRPVGVEGRLPAVFSIHGGGYIFGSMDMDDAKFDSWCPRFRCVGISVDYRLSPETAYPGPLEDCYVALKWVHDHAEEIGVDVARVGIAGVSAGGGLAAALALLVRDRGQIPIAFQLLECPMVDDRQLSSSSQLDGLAVWSRESNTYGWRAYLGELYGTEDIPGYAVPARADDLHGLPPGLVICGGADGFRDEDVEYALRLNQSGVPTELHLIPGAPHGVQMFTGTWVARRWASTVETYLERVLA